MAQIPLIWFLPVIKSIQTHDEDELGCDHWLELISARNCPISSSFGKILQDQIWYLKTMNHGMKLWVFNLWLSSWLLREVTLSKTMPTYSLVIINSEIEVETDNDKLCEYPPNLEGCMSLCIADLKSLEAKDL